jgi:hypothetical protein
VVDLCTSGNGSGLEQEGDDHRGGARDESAPQWKATRRRRPAAGECGRLEATTGGDRWGSGESGLDRSTGSKSQYGSSFWAAAFCEAWGCKPIRLRRPLQLDDQPGSVLSSLPNSAYAVGDGVWICIDLVKNNVCCITLVVCIIRRCCRL